MCKNKVTIYVPSGYGMKKVKSKCGNTGAYGEMLFCDSCEEEYAKQYPQGWRDIPGDICKHGNYIGNPAYGPDYICGECEDEYEDE